MLSFASAPGNLFNRNGKLGLLVKQAKSYQTSQLVNFTDTTNGAVAQYNAESDLQALLGSAYIGQLNGIGSNVGGLASNIATVTCNRMVFRDNPRIAQNLQSVNILDSVVEIIRQMGVAGASVLAMTIGATPSGFTGIGNGVVNVSTKRPFDGLILQNIFAETVLLTCTSDSYTGGATAGNEGFVLTGVGNQQNYFAFDWPLGSNATLQVSAIDGSVSNGSGNLQTNSGFEDWTSNVPDNFTLVVGVAGTNIAEETSITYDAPPNKSCRITGDSAGTLTQFEQQYDDADGTAGALDPITQYSFNIFIRRDGVAPGAGVLEFAWVDENDIIINDEFGTPNSFTVDLTLLTTVFASYLGVFRTPRILPDEIYLRVRLTTALTNGRSIYLDKMSLGEMQQMYTSGEYFAMHAGSIPFNYGDFATCVMTNSRGAGGTLSTFQTLFAQLMPGVMLGSELMLPYSNVPTVADSLIG